MKTAKNFILLLSFCLLLSAAGCSRNVPESSCDNIYGLRISDLKAEKEYGEITVSLKQSGGYPLVFENAGPERVEICAAELKRKNGESWDILNDSYFLLSERSGLRSAREISPDSEITLHIPCYEEWEKSLQDTDAYVLTVLLEIRFDGKEEGSSVILNASVDLPFPETETMAETGKDPVLTNIDLTGRSLVGNFRVSEDGRELGMEITFPALPRTGRPGVSSTDHGLRNASLLKKTEDGWLLLPYSQMAGVRENDDGSRTYLLSLITTAENCFTDAPGSEYLLNIQGESLYQTSPASGGSEELPSNLLEPGLLSQDIYIRY